MLKKLFKKAGKALLPKVASKLIGEGKALKKAKLILDRNNDGIVSLSDFPELGKYGDINQDGSLNLEDLIALSKRNNRKKLYLALGVVVLVASMYLFAPDLLMFILSLSL